MEKVIIKFKEIIRFIIVMASCREFAFIYCLLGCISQITHTYFLTSSISSLDGNFKVIQATLISTFISSSLLYFVMISSDDTSSKEYKQNKLAVNLFTFIEIVINLYYYCRHLIIDAEQWRIFDFIFAILVSCLIPVTIKLYANKIKAKEWLDAFDVKTNQDLNKDNIVQEFDEEKLNEKIETRVNELMLKLQNSEQTEVQQIDKEEIVSEVFNKFKSEYNIEDFIKNIVETFQNELKTNIENNNSDTVEFDESKVIELINNAINEKMKDFDDNISLIFSKNQEKIVKQIQNKCTLIVEEFQNNLKTNV